MADDLEEDIQEDIDNGQDDISNDVELEDDIQQENKVEKRIRTLSNKVRLTSKERDEFKALNDKLKTEKDSAKKEVEFYSSFSDTSDKYPAAREYKDEIKKKVLAGYSVDDAAVAILAREGKLTMPTPKVDNPAGGSATNLPLKGDSKTIETMTREEKREEIMRAVERGDISV